MPDLDDEPEEHASGHPLESGTTSPEFQRRSGASTDEGDLKPGERRRGGEDVRED
jgi:hypothetical protein